MFNPSHSKSDSVNRRVFVRDSLTVAAGVAIGGAFSPGRCRAAAGHDQLAFQAKGKEFSCHTGLLSGTLRGGGKSLGLTPLIYNKSGTRIAGKYGLVSHYRLLDSKHRYGHAGWTWASTATLLPEGHVQVKWTADAEHPFDMQAEYHWSAPGALDVTTRVTAHQDLRNFEVFLASYFSGFAEARVYVQHLPDTATKSGLMEATRALGPWQTYPRDAAAVPVIQDGRWQRPPNPVDWKIMPQLAAPLALRRDATTGLVGLLMAPRDDCFAISTPYGADGHRSLYLSLLGRNIHKDQHAMARARLIIARNVSNEQAIALYHDYEQSRPANAAISHESHGIRTVEFERMT